MKTIVTYSKHGYGTVPRIVDQMMQEVELLRARKGDRVPQDADLLIRWATRVRFPAKKTINNSSAIGLSSNKTAARLTLQRAEVPVPKTAALRHLPGGMFEYFEDWNYPLVVRPEKHRAGKDFLMVSSYQELQDRIGPKYFPGYVSEFYDKTHEYRVHVAHGRVMLVHEKLPRNEEDRDQPVWNHAMNNFYFKVLRWGEWPLDAIKVALAALKVLGLDYAGIDVMGGAPRHDFSAVVCEVNTAPTLENYAQSQYALYWDWLVATGGKEPHFESLESDNPADYLIRNWY